jgi:hypothetical protein
LSFTLDLGEFAGREIPINCRRASELTWYDDDEVIDKASPLKGFYESPLKLEEKPAHSMVVGYVRFRVGPTCRSNEQDFVLDLRSMRFLFISEFSWSKKVIEYPPLEMAVVFSILLHN